MTPLHRIAVIGNSLPRRCGIATFTTDLHKAISMSRADLETSIVAMTDPGQAYDYPPAVAFQIKDGHIDDYMRAADFLNAGRFDIVCLQHEFGIFGGEAGAHILVLLSRLTMPVVTTFHTVLARPTAKQRAVVERIVDASSKVVVMANKGRELLRDVYLVPDDKIEVIAHGIPDVAFVGSDAAKARFGFAGKSVILTFGLLSPNKGIEVMIDAMPSIMKRCTDAVYVVLGATHPNLVRDQGEAYREGLMARVRELGIQDHVVFLDRFVDLATLLEFISMCDVYVTPYLNEAQMTSGTLAYSFGLGKPVVSTPYWHARELLTEGCGVLVPFGDAAAIGGEIANLLTDDVRRQAMSRRAYAASRMMTWECTAERYMSVFETARHGHRPRVFARSDMGLPGLRGPAPPDMQIGHFLSMCDDVGLLQHAVHSVPDRAHGYCVDDNARALLLACALNNPGEQPLSEILTARFAAFVQHAWNPDTGQFRNFMGFNRTWLEDRGSEDSHGRTLWALGEAARTDASPARRRWAAALFAQALSIAESFRSPRAWAFMLLGLDAYCAVAPDDLHAREVRHSLADRLMSCLASVETSDWVWFEEGLAYDNARLPQALMLAGMATQTPQYIDAGLRSLRWLMTQQTTAAGQFRPVGTSGFGEQRQHPRAFDQQPVEATATIAACLTAWRADGDAEWKAMATRAFAWFLGSNDLSVALVDPLTGSCRDGLHPDRANENRGGESVVCYLLGLAEMRQLARVNASLTRPIALRAVGA
ncbi:glycosyltransferase involved in cell wall biosynthesis [Bradyrhizobium diazoefficiens]|jgi:glycosyltransferase involved in cell wall biosynthesis|uniref:Glycosyl transferase n=1 Tax=Bradyrhizobium diazoefficiens TaxID=1355477 RepID=A0A809YKQ6_9BRAD|nr:glycosyltransferase family 4 protein [Bradyrhizobium diazoefficiens]MBP1064701.1 glycosyltransferase involved in cell wall biosynthesis [Bradyrhizobium japonicum]WLA53492.1 glycosyltransferase family 4 protein [Bradyrhizobium diazoefficiens]BCA04990.1 glycosyl transferase [Bradyrhizobium diazoefficiens]BCA22345.1 glycosyl transferase [Bradyrhizobium diazoefficiens]BCE31724.1 glycosyl transferase [Bradyrhizobium diazoefficiens]